MLILHDYHCRLRLLPPRILLVELLAQEDARKLAARRLWALELAVRNVVVKRFELVLGQPTGEGAQALVPEAVPFQFARRHLAQLLTAYRFQWYCRTGC